MQATVELGTVLTCSVTNWSYNRSLNWKAPGITVGDAHAMCDTFTTEDVVGMSDGSVVNSCLVEAWHYNDARLWKANGVTVGDHNAHADCLTYQG